MRRVVAILFISALGPVLFAQGTFPLAWQDVPGYPGSTLLAEDRMVNAVDYDRAAPKAESTGLRRFRVPVGGREVLVGFLGSERSTIYVDTEGNLGKLTPLQSQTPISGARFFDFGPVGIAGAAKGTTVRVRLRVYEDRVAVRAAGYRSGHVRLDGKDYLVAVADGDLDGRFDGTFTLAHLADKVYDRLAIDLNGDGRFDWNVTSCEVQPLPRIVQIGGAWWSVKVAPDGSTIEFARAEPPMGSIDVGTSEAELVLWSENGACRLSGAPGRWPVPAGQYTTVEVRALRADAAGGIWSMTSRETPALAAFEVRTSQTFSTRLGAPFVARPDIFKTMNAQAINFAIFGQGGEKYSPNMSLNGKPQEPPQLRIASASGQILESGKFALG